MEIQKRIIQCAEELMLRYGVKNITMDEIARKMGISKKTIYQFFSDKNELVCSVVKKHLEEKDQILQQIAGESADPVD